MGTPSSSEIYQQNGAVVAEESVAPTGDQRLAEIDSILEDLSRRDLRDAASTATKMDARQAFLRDFGALCEQVVRPAMAAVLERLQLDGGGGLIEEHPGGETRFSTPRITLWMSLQGEIVGSPRPDRHPYLQLDANVTERQVRVSAGGMWRGRGGHSGRMGAWRVREITHERVIEELLAILRRSAAVPASDQHRSDVAALASAAVP